MSYMYIKASLQTLTVAWLKHKNTKQSTELTHNTKISCCSRGEVSRLADRLRMSVGRQCCWRHRRRCWRRARQRWRREFPAEARWVRRTAPVRPSPSVRPTNADSPGSAARTGARSGRQLTADRPETSRLLTESVFKGKSELKVLSFKKSTSRGSDNSVAQG